MVLGGGAVGLMCAIEAGNRGRSVAVLERATRIGKKILISGGGRCNFTTCIVGLREMQVRAGRAMRLGSAEQDLAL
jgi:predicted flavoprotein YhiN